MIDPNITDLLPLEISLKDKIREFGQYSEASKGTELLRVGQYVKVVPLVIEGLIKVFSQYEEKELLLYYIQPTQSCIMSFTAGLHHEKSIIAAVAEEDSKLILLPTDKINSWIREYPSLNTLFFDQYAIRYQELLFSLNHLLFDSLEEKIRQYLKNKIEVTGQKIFRIRHKEIANDLGTSREVLSRIIKKMEHQGLLQQLPEGMLIRF